jgi:hypothetical protein
MPVKVVAGLVVAQFDNGADPRSGSVLDGPGFWMIHWHQSQRGSSVGPG